MHIDLVGLFQPHLRFVLFCLSHNTFSLVKMVVTSSLIHPMIVLTLVISLALALALVMALAQQLPPLVISSMIGVLDGNTFTSLELVLRHFHQKHCHYPFPHHRTHVIYT
ncbi:hypothetical protein O6H91_05G085000 [Diphasiastrum complanatum]|uniref:Uncharacterized protein n=1 Tax=Diphasiastrum complanatum TaxID=34168 RepID=A0ACC2DQA8_DIPCM|nr:hypothetical protein O6H91_05G085000 [Diphasiastrum complanatum]